jgi:hypothetical protein
MSAFLGKFKHSRNCMIKYSDALTPFVPPNASLEDIKGRRPAEFITPIN